MPSPTDPAEIRRQHIIAKATDIFLRYGHARTTMSDIAQAAGLSVQSHAHPLPGRDGEALAMDIARFGAADAKRLLIITSACHGVEGFCGSGVQNALLASAGFHMKPPVRTPSCTSFRP